MKEKIFNNTIHSFNFDKDNIKFLHKNIMLSKLQTMFDYENLPETLPKFNLENILLSNGHCIVTQVDIKDEEKTPFKSGLYALSGAGGGEPNPYYFPTKYVVANPYLNISKTYTIGENNVLCKNTSYYFPLLPLIEFYAHLLTENELTMNIATINTRIITILTANTTDVKNACEKYMKDIEEGKLSTIQDNRSDFLDGIKTHPYASSGHNNVITQIIENEQYLKASFYNEIGYNANYNMKRESINGNEADMNSDGLTPLVVDMLNCRKKFVDDINKMFNLENPIKVKLSPILEKNIKIAETIPEDKHLKESEVFEDVGTEENE